MAQSPSNTDFETNPNLSLDFLSRREIDRYVGTETQYLNNCYILVCRVCDVDGERKLPIPRAEPGQVLSV